MSVENKGYIDYINVDYTVCGNVINMSEYEIDIYDNLFLNVIETEYTEGTFGYDLSVDIAWLHEEKTGVLSKEEYDEFIYNLKTAYQDGQYIFTKPYYIYKGIKK